MEWVGWIALIIIICYSSYPSKIRRLESKVKRLDRKQEGNSNMSKIIIDLVGQECIINTTEVLDLITSKNIPCKILDADDEWVKITYIDKKNNIKTKIFRIDGIESVEIINE